MTPYHMSLLGGAVIGFSAVLLLLINGRIAGISGILGRLAQGAHLSTNAAFTIGLIAGPALLAAVSGYWPASTVTAPPALLAVSGLLVGFGTRMGSGCTSGHGIIGLARLSPRSIAATAAFLGSGIAAAVLSRHIG